MRPAAANEVVIIIVFIIIIIIIFIIIIIVVVVVVVVVVAVVCIPTHSYSETATIPALKMELPLSRRDCAMAVTHHNSKRRQAAGLVRQQ